MYVVFQMRFCQMKVSEKEQQITDLKVNWTRTKLLYIVVIIKTFDLIFLLSPG